MMLKALTVSPLLSYIFWNPIGDTVVTYYLNFYVEDNEGKRQPMSQYNQSIL